MKFKFLILFLAFTTMISCGDDKKKNAKEASDEQTEAKEVVEEKTDNSKSTIDVTHAYPDDKGIGPVKSMELAPVDEALAETGKELYKIKCTACHKLKKRYIGPALLGVTERRSPEWIMNMMLNPMQMLAENELAKALIAEYNAPMADQQLTEEEARALLEFLRLKDKK